LQVVGIHDAVTPVPPVCDPAITPAVLTEATVGFVLLQMRGGVVSSKPAESSTVAVIVCAVLTFVSVSELPPAAVTRLIDSTGQVMKVRDGLVVFPAEAKNCVCPGVLAVART